MDSPTSIEPSWLKLVCEKEEHLLAIIWLEVGAATAIIALAALQSIDVSEEHRWLFQPLATFGAVVFSVWIAVSQPARARQASERAIAIAAAQAGLDAIELVAERMRPRLDPQVQQDEGRTLRGHRSRSTVEALGDIKLSDLPPTYIKPFNRLRSGLVALTEAMDEDPWPTVGKPLSDLQLRRFARYAASFTWSADAYDAIRKQIRAEYHLELPEFGWKVPAGKELRSRDEARFPGVAPRPIPGPRKQSPAKKRAKS